MYLVPATKTWYTGRSHESDANFKARGSWLSFLWVSTASGHKSVTYLMQASISRVVFIGETRSLSEGDAGAAISRTYTHDWLWGGHLPLPKSPELTKGTELSYAKRDNLSLLIWGIIGRETLSVSVAGKNLNIKKGSRYFRCSNWCRQVQTQLERAPETRDARTRWRDDRNPQEG